MSVAGPRILVVDDEPAILRTVRANLARHGFRVDTAATAQEALEHAQARPDLILLDLGLPDGDGLELIRSIRENASLASLDRLSRAGVVGIELLAAAQGCDFHRPLTSSPALEAARSLVRAQVPHLDDDRYFHPDMATAIELVRSGAVVRAAADVSLPGVTG